MKPETSSKLLLGTIALSLGAIALRPSPAPAVPTSSTSAVMPYGDFEFVPQGQTGFIAVNRRTGDFSYYQLNAPNNQWKWDKVGPTGNLATLGTPPAPAQ